MSEVRLVNVRHMAPAMVAASPWAARWVSASELHHAGGLFSVEVHWALRQGRYEPQLFSVDGGAGDVVLSASLLRRLPSGQVIDQLRAALAEEIDRQVRAATDGAGGDQLTPERFDAYRAELAAADDVQAVRAAEASLSPALIGTAVARGTVVERDARAFGAQRGRRLTPDDLGAVAAAYHEARRHSRPVQASVAAAMGVSRSAAAKRIMAARAAGLLDEVPGR